MNRLTKDLHNQYNDYWYREDLEQVSDKEEIVLTKLGMLEDIEEELGIGLITLFKALKNGFYTKSNNGIKFWKEDDKHFVYVRDLKYDIEICCEECENVIGAVPTMFLERSTKDYGKTWALSREELENETIL